MDNLEGFFAQKAKESGQSQSAPVNQPGQASSMEGFFSQKAQQAPQTPATSTHGAVYNAADSVLNSQLPGKTDSGSPMLDQIGDSLRSLNPIDMGRGIVKGALSTAAGVGSIVNKLTGAQQPFNQSNLSGLTDAQNAGQGIGKMGEQVGEFAGGERLAAKAGLSGIKGVMAAGGAMSGLQSGGDAGAITVGTVLPAIMSAPVVKMAGKSIAKALGVPTSKGEASIARAFLNPHDSDLVDGLKGNITITDAVSNLQKEVSDYSEAAGASYRSRLPATMNNNIQGWHGTSGKIVSDLKNTFDKQLSNFGVQKLPDGSLDMKHLTGASEEDVLTIANKLNNWGNEARDFTPQGLDTLKKQISKMAYDSGSALPSRLADQLKTELNAQVPGYKTLTKEYHDSQDVLRQVKQTLNSSGKESDNAATIAGKLQNLLNQNTNFREMVLKKLPNGDKILNQLAGIHLHDVLPGKVSQRLLGAMITGGIGFHPIGLASIPGAAVSSPRLIGEGARIAGKIAQSGLPIRDTARRAVTAGANGMLSGSQ